MKALLCFLATLLIVQSIDLKKLSSYEVLHVSSPREHFPFTAQYAKDHKDEYWNHPESTWFSFTLDSETKVHVELNKHTTLFGKDYHETYLSYDKDGQLIGERRAKRTQKDRACYYKGTVTVNGLRMANQVFVSTCMGGFATTLQVHSETVVIEPASEHFNSEALQMYLESAQALSQFESQVARRPQLRDGSFVQKGSMHLIYKLSNYQTEGLVDWCGQSKHAHTSSVEDQVNHVVKELNAIAGVHAKKASSSSSKFATQSLTQTVELCVVNDYSRITRLGSNLLTDTNQGTIPIVGQVSLLYHNSFMTQTPNVEVVLVSVYNFDRGDPYPFFPFGSMGEVDVEPLLAAFHSWASGPSTNLTHHDNRQLFSGFDFKQAVLGYAGVGTMCQAAQSGGIDQTWVGDYPLAAYGAVVAHEMGHNFGMNHDNDGNTCPPSGWIMNSLVDTNNAPTNFSACSFSYWATNNANNNNLPCLQDVPTVVFGDRVCGNGFVELGEECDCGINDLGNPSACAAAGDPCCDSSTCLLITGSQCSNNFPCCSNCMIIPASANVTCRPKSGVCDLAETCLGVNGYCPDDVVIGAGNSCTDPNYGGGVCYEGLCSSLQRDCRIKGAGISGPGLSPPFDACDSLDPSSGDGFCQSLQCQQHSGGNCLTFTSGGADAIPIRVGDGVSCGSGRQCVLGSCVLSSTFDPKHVWEVGDYYPCSSCDAPQTAPVFCVYNAPDFSTQVVADVVCSPSGKPIASRACRNDTLQLTCIIAPNDNSLDRWARNLAEQYGALDKAKSIRDAVPRWPGYPTEFSTTDPDYRKGVELTSIVPFILAGAALIVWISWCCCLKQKSDDANELKGGNYTACKKYTPLFFAFLCVLIMVIFACVGLFFNGELRRGCCESSTGANHLMNQIIADALSLSATLADPIKYLNASAATVVSSANVNMAQVTSGLTQGTTPISSTLGVISTKYNGYSYTSGPFGGAYPSPITYHCNWCSDLAVKVNAINAELLPINNAINALFVAASNASNVLNVVQQRFWYTNDLNNLAIAAVKVQEVHDKALDKQDLVAEATDKADTADRIFHPFCIVFLSFVFIILLIVVLGGLCFKHKSDVVFGYSVHLNFCMLFGSMTLLAFAIPLMTVTGDSCEYLNKAEADIPGTLNVSIITGRILQSCLISTPMSDALNLTEALVAMGVLTFPDVASVSFVTPTLDRLVANVTSPQYTAANAFGDWSPTLVDYDCQQLSANAGTWVGRNNVTSFDDSASPQIVKDWKAAAVAHLVMEAVFNQLLVDIKANVTLAKNMTLTLFNTYVTDSALYRSTGVGSTSQLSLLNNAANKLLSNNNCGNLGNDYHDFKTAWCDVMTTSLSFLGLVFFFIGVFALPALILSRKLTWLLQKGTKEAQDYRSDIEVADARY